MTEYPTPEEIHAVHDDIIDSHPESEPGHRNPAAVESALIYISDGYFGETPETIHRKAAHLMRLLVAEHPYVDGNKRTALTAVAILYDLNGYEFTPDDQVRAHLHELATDATEVDIDALSSYLRERSRSHE